ncbi:DUF3800 domain-containing protein [Bacillus thuringiensis]|uniref:DUF3800 domain-containing protein n=1 Tax=Bacillus thuringiensis TaxID=1428 RepID=UPI000BF4A086|nr:DUF3800 domain-containing protein [Bacillus thuringiensis]PEZ31997.1 hypothetical protein CN346_19100 [Bacillus thuringiensis]
MSEHDAILAGIDEEVLREEEQEQGEQEEIELTEEEKAEERRKKAEALWKDVQMGNEKHLITRVASIMNRYPETRNSDVALMIKYWKVYEGQRGSFVSLEKLFEMERLTSIARTRAKIQNEYNLFQADKKYKRYRQDKEEQQKEIQIITKPSMQTIHIYADESGKNDDFLLVGSFWILANEDNLNGKIVNWIQERKKVDNTCPDEFHFHKIRNNGMNFEVYKDFFDFVISNGSMVSFKGIAVNKTKLTQHTDDIITELYYQLVRVGIDHESKTGRIELPKQIEYIKDHEEGESALRINQIRQSLTDNFKLHYEENLNLTNFMSVDSKFSRFIQIADLFTGALNRKYNIQRKSPDQVPNAKDKLAEYILSVIGLKEVLYPAELYNEEVLGASDMDMATIYIFD